MGENNSELIETIKKTVSDFLVHRLNEDVNSISVVLLPDIITVFCRGCFTPAELQLTKEKMQFHLLLMYTFLQSLDQHQIYHIQKYVNSALH